MANLFILAILQGAFYLITVLTHAQQDHSGFISIDCGISGVSTYEDETTGITYVSDSNFVDPGENMNISSVYMTQTNDMQLLNLRSFPKGTRNCYSLKPSLGNDIRYFIRARFLYGNYDGKNQSPAFHLYLGVDKWDTIIIDEASVPIDTEFIFSPPSDYIFVCLVNTNLGTPFISALELRPIRDNVYVSQSVGSGSLKLYYRYDFGTEANQTMRYKDDAYDRLWSIFSPKTGWDRRVSTSLKNSVTRKLYEPPSIVMSTASTVKNVSENLGIIWSQGKSTKYFLYMYFAELEELQYNQTREFGIYVNNNLWYSKAVVPQYLISSMIYSTSGERTGNDGWFRVMFSKTNTSTLPPLVNAMEIYTEEQLSQLETDQQDVDAISNIKSTYKVKKNWQGDPCSPQDYMWDGLKCSYNETQTQPRIIHLDLSSSGLTGEIVSSFANLTMLRYLDLSNNSLNETVPEILAQLSFLRVLNLKGNKLKGPIPKTLLMNNDLSLSFDANTKENQTSCSMGSCKKKHNFVVPVVLSVGGFILLLTAVSILWWFIRKPENDIVAVAIVKETSNEENESYMSKKQQFTYSEILNITNNFENILGRGGFGIVYHGYLNGHDVAVKMLSPSSIQGHREFHAELKLLLRVHHKNLTALVGYCIEGENIGVIYEYMAMGNLSTYLSVNSRKILSWEDRLRIALDTAQGLEYLHNGCKPPIVHRDVKTSNILLNEKFQAKLSDFGLSKIFPIDCTHVSTIIAGTPGYLDPEYCISHRLNEKSDVYSYGVVLMEIIIGKPAISKGKEEYVHITRLVDSMLASGDVGNIVDPKLRGSYDIGSAWKAIEVSMTCASQITTKRPSMSHVVVELKECMVSELACKEGHGTELGESMELVSLNMITELSPSAR